MTLKKELLELSKDVNNFYKIHSVSNINNTIELSGEISIPYTFSCEALHPGYYKGFNIEEKDIILGQSSIFRSEGNFHNNEINKDHKNSRKATSSVDDIIGKVTKSNYDYSKQAYILEGEIYDEAIALKVAKKLIKYVSLRINFGRVEYVNGEKYARDLSFEELSFVRVPGDNNARIIVGEN